MKIYTRTAGVINLADPVDIRRLVEDDLWYGLARRRRYGAQLTWTVHQHSLLVEELAPPELRMKAKMHDLSEGLLGDVQKPLRDMLGASSPYEQAHAFINAELARRRGWGEGWEEECREWDQRAFEIEVQMFVPPSHWNGFFGDWRPAPPTLIEKAIVRDLIPLGW
jgi:hypothetical protein